MMPSRSHFGTRRWLVLAVIVIACLSGWYLRLNVAELWPAAAGRNWGSGFLQAALNPATTYERTPPPDAAPFWQKVLSGSMRTILFALASTSLAFIAGLLLAILTSSAWWHPAAGASGLSRSPVGLGLRVIIRSFGICCRSVHELLWAVLFLSAFGLNELTAILAIAIPYTGVFIKVFGEILDESPRDAADALQAMGSSSTQAFAWSVLPRALPDMLAYASYRLECALRSAAVLGFFGIPTLGYYLQPAFLEQHYREVWTYLYALLLLIVAVDIWSGVVRRRLVG